MTMLYRRSHILTLIVTLAGGSVAFGQAAANQAQPEPTLSNQQVRSNSIQAGQPVAAVNKIVTPVPLSAGERDTALDGIDRHIGEQVVQLKEKLKNVLPDELAILTKTTGWQPEKQNALLVALRSADPAAVYEAWTQGNPQDSAGAEITARQTDVKRVFAHLEQDVKNKTAINQDVAELDAALSKIASSTPTSVEAQPMVSMLKTWADVRKLVEAAVPENGPTAKLPTGKVSLVYDPGLPVGKAVVLSDNAVLVGNHGRGPLSITLGNAAAALGLPIVTSIPLPAAQGQEVASGVLLVNPPTSRATVNYNINGTRYVMEPGMGQRLQPAPQWVIEYDRGEGIGLATYTMTDGTYYFTPTDKGWQLYKEKFEVVLDNSQNPQEFNFVFHGKTMTVPANGTLKLDGIYPLVVKFDRGNGSELAVKSMRFVGTVEVGVNPTTNTWDLFPTNENQREVTNLKLFQ
jgi:hypothetical protein